jgi:hypothetical protein
MNPLRRRLFLALACLPWPLSATAQVKVTLLAPNADVSGFYTASGLSGLHGSKRLTIPLLNLTFVSNSGFLPPTRDAVDRDLPASLRLSGLQPADLQQIADAVNDAFVAELKAQGLEVMPYDPLSVNPGFQELAHRAPRAGREQAAPEKFQDIASVSGARGTMTFVAYRCPWVDSFMLTNYLPASRVTRELDATLPIVSFLVDFIGYSTERTATFSWGAYMPGAAAATIPALRAAPQIYVAAGSATLLTPDGQTVSLTLNAPIGFPHAFVTRLVPTRGRTKEERKGGSYEVVVNPAAYREAVIEALKPQVETLARKLAAGMQ